MAASTVRHPKGPPAETPDRAAVPFLWAFFDSSVGAKITVVELMDQLIPGADRDIVAPLAKRIGKLYEKILLKTKVTAVEAKPEGLHVVFEGEGGETRDVFDALLVSVGRRPNGRAFGAEAAGVAVNERGFIYFWPIKDITMPNLWVAVAGDRKVADAHDDPGHATWGWKDSMLGKRQWYYAKVLRKKATMISLKTAPFFYALSENYDTSNRKCMATLC